MASRTSNIEVPAEMREFAEKSVSQAREAFDLFLVAARKTANTLTTSADQANDDALTMSSRGFKFAEQNVYAAFDLAQKLSRAKDLNEAVQFQSEFVRSQTAAYEAQAKEYGDFARNALQQGAESGRTAVDHGTAAATEAINRGNEAAPEAPQVEA